MDNKLIKQSIILTLVLAAMGFAGMSTYTSFVEGLSLFLGGVWGAANLWMITMLLQNLLLPDQRSFLKIFAYMALKFPLLYFAGYLLATDGYFSLTYLMVGSSIIFLGLAVSALQIRLPKGSIPLIFFLVVNNELCATLDADVPEIPNFISLLHKIFHDAPWANFLFHWETLIFSLIVATGISIVFYFGSRKSELIPSGLQNVLEWIVENLRNFILEVLGPEGKKYVPFLGTLFVYILTMNWMVLVPLMKAPTSNFNITVALALCVFVLVQYLNIRNYGLLGFIYHLMGSPKDFMGWALVPLMLPIELLTQFTRPVTLALRLFGNVVGEDILIGAFALFGVALLSAYAPVGVPLQIPFMFLSLLTGLMQALVFTLLSTIYILLSVPEIDGHSAHVSV